MIGTPQIAEFRSATETVLGLEFDDSKLTLLGRRLVASNGGDWSRFSTVPRTGDRQRSRRAPRARCGSHDRGNVFLSKPGPIPCVLGTSIARMYRAAWRSERDPDPLRRLLIRRRAAFARDCSLGARQGALDYASDSRGRCESCSARASRSRHVLQLGTARNPGGASGSLVSSKRPAILDPRGSPEARRARVGEPVRRWSRCMGARAF